MENSVKNSPSPKLGFLIWVSFLSTIIFAVPFKAYATIWDQVIGAFLFLPTLALKLILQLILLITQLLVSLSSWLLNWVTNDDFIGLPYTTTENPVIEAGLGVTQSFVNMGIVLALIFIAFAMILRIKGYETTRVFITLIVVALLVNFAPVLVGLVVDASNIIMHYFTDNITGMAGVSNLMAGHTDGLIPQFKDISILKQGTVLIKTFIMILLNLGFFFVLMMFVFIFMLRYVAIWVLVILSPLAFVSYILPRTRSFFEQWWKQLIQWSFIGAIAAFFLYLAEQITKRLKDLDFGSAGSGPGDLDVGFFEEIFPYFVPLIFLIIGVTLALKGSAAGANVVTGAAQNVLRTTGGQAKEKMKGAYKGAYKDIRKRLREKTPQEAKDKAAKLAQKDFRFKFGTERKGLPKVAGGIANTILNSTTAIPRWATKGIRETGLRTKESDKKDIKEAEEKAKNMSPERIASILNTSGSTSEQLGALISAIKNNKINDVKKNINKDHVSNIAMRALQQNHQDEFKTIMKHDPEEAENIWKKIGDKKLGIQRESLEKNSKLKMTDEEERQGMTITQKAVKEFIKKPKDLETMDPKSAKNKEIIAELIKKGDPRFIGKLGQDFGKGAIDSFQELINTIEFKEEGYVEKNLPQIARYIGSSAGQVLGLKVEKRDPEEITKEEEERKIIVNNANYVMEKKGSQQSGEGDDPFRPGGTSNTNEDEKTPNTYQKLNTDSTSSQIDKNKIEEFNRQIEGLDKQINDMKNKGKNKDRIRELKNKRDKLKEEVNTLKKGSWYGL